MTMTTLIFFAGLCIHLFLLSMLLLSWNKPDFQFWPPPNKQSWQYYSLWWSIRLLVLSIAWLIYSDNTSMNISETLRFYVAMPIFVVSFTLGSVAAIQLGWKNTHGEADQFITSGFYKYSRNPQYVFYAISFLSLGVWADSLKTLILLSLLSLWYLRAPFPEEKWLQKHYGNAYLKYKNKVPRYFKWR